MRVVQRNDGRLDRCGTRQLYLVAREDRPAREVSAAMLTAVGFRYVADADCWVHIEHERAITKETVAAHDTHWLARWITDS